MRPPLDGVLRVTQLFGGNPASEAWIGSDGARIGHDGIDLACGFGSPVYPASSGKAQVIYDSGGFGLHVLVTDDKRRQFLYAHLSSVSVNTGDRVEVHQPFAKSGSSGNSTGPHLHFGIRESPINYDNSYGGFRDPLGGFDSDVRFDLSLTNL